MINTKVHAVLDYLLGLVLIASPWLLGYRPAGPQYQVPLVVALISISLAATTRFEYSLVNLVPLRTHLFVDVLSGILLACSPLLFAFRPVVYKPHVVFGLSQVVIGLLTDRMLYDKIKTIRTSTDHEGDSLRKKQHGKEKS